MHTGAQWGGPGDALTCSVNALAGEVYYVSTGTAGGNGVNNSVGGGGAAGYALPGFSGGAGGGAGPRPYSGGGGGGGGATVLYTYINGNKKYLAVAAGGPGGGGAGNHSHGHDFTSDHARAYYAKYYPPVGNGSSRASSVNKTYGVQTTPLTYPYILTYSYINTSSADHTLYASADDLAYMYVNGVYVGQSASWNSISATSITLATGLNTLSFTVYNTGGGPTNFGAYINNSSGLSVWTSRSQYNVYDMIYNQGRGGEGQTHKGDGGGGGGGGGGFFGGQGGTAAGGDYGGSSGKTGMSFATNNINNIGIPLIRDQWSAVATTSIAKFGHRLGDWHGHYHGPEVETADGSFTATSSIGSSISIRQSGKWKKISELYYRQNDQFTSVKQAYVRQNGAWVEIINNDTFTVNQFDTVGENNTSGYIVPYSAQPVVVVESVPVYSVTASITGTPIYVFDNFEIKITGQPSTIYTITEYGTLYPSGTKWVGGDGRQTQIKTDSAGNFRNIGDHTGEIDYYFTVDGPGGFATSNTISVRAKP